MKLQDIKQLVEVIEDFVEAKIQQHEEKSSSTAENYLEEKRNRLIQEIVNITN